MFLVGPTIARSRRVEESKAFSTDGESDESDESDRRGATPRDCYKIGWVGLCRSDSSTRASDESATPGRDSSDRRVAAARRVGATRPTSGTSTVGQVSRSRSDSGRRVDSSYTRPKSNVTRASEHKGRDETVEPTLTPPGPGSSICGVYTAFYALKCELTRAKNW